MFKKKTRYVLLIDTGKLASKCHELKHKKLRHIEYTLLLVHKRLVDQRFKRGTRPFSFFFSFTIGLFKPHDDRGGILEIGKVDCNCHLVGVQDLLVLRTQLLIQHQDHLVLLPKNLHHWEEVLLRDYHTLKFDKVLYLVAVDRVNHSQRSRK